MKVNTEKSPAKINRIAIIGTGPVSLLKAYLLAKTDASNLITLIDSAAQIGGAWHSDKSPKGYEIENGCHIWSYVPKAYKFIEKELGISLFTMRQSPVFIGKRLRVPYSVKNSVDLYKELFKTAFSLKWNRFKNLKSDPNMNYRIFGKKNKYPKTGSMVLVHALEKKIHALAQIKILLRTSVESMNINDTIQITTESDMYEFDQLFITYVSQIKSLSINGQAIQLNVQKIDYIHFLIDFDKPLKKKLSYWRILNDKIVHRITDISYQTKFEENLILVGIKGTAYENNTEDDLMTHVIGLLKQNALIDDSYTIKKIKTHIFPTHYLDDSSLELIRSHKDKINLMYTPDLMFGIYYLLEERLI